MGWPPLWPRTAGPAHHHDPRGEATLPPFPRQRAGTQLPQWLWSVPGQGRCRRPLPLGAHAPPCLLEPARQALPPPGPCTEVPSESLPRSLLLDAPGGVLLWGICGGRGALGGGSPRRRASAGKVVSGGGGEPRRGLHGHSPIASLGGCFFRGPLTVRAEESRVRGRTSGGSERRKGTIYLRANPPLAPVASPWRPSARARANLPRAGGRRRGDGGGGASTMWRKAVWFPFSGTIQVKIKDFSLSSHRIVLQKCHYQQAAENQETTGINAKTYTNKYGVRLNNRPEKAWVLANGRPVWL